MQQFIILISLILIAFILSHSVLPVFWGEYSDLFLPPILVLALAVFYVSKFAAVFAAALTGILIDLFNPYVFGIFILALMLSVLVSHFFLNSLFRHRHFISLVIINLLFIFFFSLSTVVTLTIGSGDVTSSFTIHTLTVFILRAFVNLIFILIVYLFIPPVRKSFAAKFDG